MAAFEDGERATGDYWEEAYAWAHGEEPQVSLSLVKKYVKWLKLKSKCALAGVDPPSPLDVEVETDDNEEAEGEGDESEDEEEDDEDAPADE